MQKIKEFEKYYVEKLRYNVFTSKHPEAHIKELFERVSKEHIDLIIDTITHKGIGFVNRASYCFNPSFNNGELNFTLKKKMDRSSIFHEFGHAIDFIRLDKVSNYKYVSYYHSKDTILSNGLTLDDTFKKEFKTKYKELYNLFFNKYKSILNKYLDDDNKDIVNTVINTVNEMNILKDKIGSTNYNKLKKCYGTQYDCNLLNKYNLDSKWLDNHFERKLIFDDYEKIKPYYQFKKKSELAKELEEFNNTYNIILDSLGSKYDVKYFWNSHTLGYFKTKGIMAVELFANAFSSLVLDEKETLDIFKEHYPKSYDAFNELILFFLKQKESFCSLKES